MAKVNLDLFVKRVEDENYNEKSFIVTFFANAIVKHVYVAMVSEEIDFDKAEEELNNISYDYKEFGNLEELAKIAKIEKMDNANEAGISSEIVRHDNYVEFVIYNIGDGEYPPVEAKVHLYIDGKVEVEIIDWYKVHDTEDQLLINLIDWDGINKIKSIDDVIEANKEFMFG